MVKLLTAAHCHPGIQILLMDQRTEQLKVSNTPNHLPGMKISQGSEMHHRVRKICLNRKVKALSEMMIAIAIPLPLVKLLTRVAIILPGNQTHHLNHCRHLFPLINFEQKIHPRE